MSHLTNQKIVSHDEMKVLTPEEITHNLSHLKDWTLEGNKIKKHFKFDDFVKAMEFVNKVADVAEKEGHHPDIQISYSKVNLTFWSHFINSLSINDFIMATKIDTI